MAVIINGTPVDAPQPSDGGVNPNPSLQGQTFSAEQPGASPFELVFADYGLRDMVEGYEISLDGNPKAYWLPSSLTSQGFTIVGGNAGDVFDVVLIGTPL